MSPTPARITMLAWWVETQPDVPHLTIDRDIIAGLVDDWQRFQIAADRLATWVGHLVLEEGSDPDGYGPERDRLLADYMKAKP